MRALNIVVSIILLLCSVRLAASAAADERNPLPTPIMRSVSPETLKAGEEATVSGEYLDKSRVSELYLTTGSVDLKVRILSQSASEIKFKVPEKAAPGRYSLMVLLTGEDPPKLIEEPTKVTIVE